ncbi:HNH endonuclease [Salmonella enterica]|nr:HNH endonuclease [Salmonella enterica]
MDYKLLFDYKEGILIKKVKLSKRCKIGDQVGWLNSSGYLQFSMRKKVYLVHRVIWEIHNGKIPDGMEVDHIDHNKLNNNIENLRLVSKKENHKNMPLQKNNKSGFCGVCFIERCNKYRSSIKVDGKTKYLGYFIDINDAIKARIDANKIFGFHNNHGG